MAKRRLCSGFHDKKLQVAVLMGDGGHGPRPRIFSSPEGARHLREKSEGNYSKQKK